MKYFSALVAALAVVGAAAAADAQPEPYDSSPVNYPWRNGVIQGPAGGPGPWGGGYDAGYNGYPGGAVPVNGYNGSYGGYAAGYGNGYYPGYGYAGAGYGAQVYPLPGGGGGFSVSQSQDGSLNVTRFGPVWSSQLAPNGGANRRYYNYGGGGGGFWSFLNSLWPF